MENTVKDCFNSLTDREFTELLEEAGFEVEDVEEGNGGLTLEEIVNIRDSNFAKEGNRN